MEILTNHQLETLTDLEITNYIRERRGQEPLTPDEWLELDQSQQQEG